MKKMILSAIFACCTASFAGARTTLDLLKQYRWESYDWKGETLVDLFTNTTYKIIAIDNVDNTTDEDPYQFYLSDNEETTFVQSKVGQVQYGNYIVAKSLDTDKVLCYRIITLNDTELYFIYCPKPGQLMVGGGPIRFYAKPK
ncbi:hypothetical protein FACS1894159_09120 [Bacteroidia bacterium]|nr:hypothetical protein FACS1894159_09120 [Bacteroidia bacterium]